MKKELKPFMVTKGRIEDWRFTNKQQSAYMALIKAAKRCEQAGLSLIAKQNDLHAYPSKMSRTDMLITGNTITAVAAPHLCGCHIEDAGADDIEYIRDKFIKNQ